MSCRTAVEINISSKFARWNYCCMKSHIPAAPHLHTLCFLSFCYLWRISLLLLCDVLVLRLHISCLSWKVNLELCHVAGDSRCSYTLLLAWARRGRVQCFLLLLHTHNPILCEFNICLIPDWLDDFLHPQEKKTKTNKKFPTKSTRPYQENPLPNDKPNQPN